MKKQCSNVTSSITVLLQRPGITLQRPGITPRSKISHNCTHCDTWLKSRALLLVITCAINFRGFIQKVFVLVDAIPRYLVYVSYQKYMATVSKPRWVISFCIQGCTPLGGLPWDCYMFCIQKFVCRKQPCSTLFFCTKALGYHRYLQWSSPCKRLLVIASIPAFSGVLR